MHQLNEFRMTPKWMEELTDEQRVEWYYQVKKYVDRGIIPADPTLAVELNQTLSEFAKRHGL